MLVRPHEEEDPDTLFDWLCRELTSSQLEQDAEGNILIMAPTGGETSYRNMELARQLQTWAMQQGRGRAFDSSVLFVLPDGSKRGPDAAWVSQEKLATLTREERRKFLRLVPDFAVELKSLTDHLSDLQRKMQNWMRNGVSLGWLIHPDKQCVFVYEGSETPVVVSSNRLLATEPVLGFELDLEQIWKGLD